MQLGAQADLGLGFQRVQVAVGMDGPSGLARCLSYLGTYSMCQYGLVVGSKARTGWARVCSGVHGVDCVWTV